MPNGVIQLPFLSDPGFGRWGNSLFTLSFCKAYADSIGAVLEIPDNWVGRTIFPHFENYPKISSVLPIMNFHYMPTGETNIALTGFYQNQTSLDTWKNRPFREWFRIRDEIMLPHKNYFQFVNESVGPMILCHRRAGDYAETPYPILSRETYYKNIDDHEVYGHDFFVGDSEKPELAQLFAGTDISFISDFIYMMLSPVLFRGNSSFSWWASALAEPGQKVYSPFVQGLTNKDTECSFVEGNWPAFLPHDDHHTDLHLT